MTIQILDIKRNGFATYRTDNRLHEYHMLVSTTMVREANKDFNGSLGDAKIGTHISKTIAKFHEKNERV